MKLKKNISRKLFIFIITVLNILFINESIKAQGNFNISPMIVDTTIPAGSEKTIPLDFSYTGAVSAEKLPIMRMVVRTEDWNIDPTGQIKFHPIGSLESSAGKWINYSPAEFTIAPNKTQLLRFTVKVPVGTKPGDYLFAVYVEDRMPPPPYEAGKRQVNMKFRYYSIITVKVPGLTRQPSLDNLKIEFKDRKFVVSPTLSNKGNSQVAAVHSYEIRDEADRVVSEMKPTATRQVLAGHEMRLIFPIKENLAIGKYKVIYKVDFKYSLPIIIGKTVFEITEADFLAQKKAGKPVAEAVTQVKKTIDVAVLPKLPEKSEVETKIVKPAEKSDKVLSVTNSPSPK